VPTSNLVHDIDYSEDYLGYLEFFKENPLLVDRVRNVMAHAQKPDFFFRRNVRVHLNRRRGSVQSTAGSRGVRIGGNYAGCTMFRGSVKSTGYTLHSPVSPSLPSRASPCAITFPNWTLPQIRRTSRQGPEIQRHHFAVATNFFYVGAMCAWFFGMEFAFRHHSGF
jgi:hypothetical protein